ncbi:MAG TPA: ABC transporter permease [Gemmatimonadaceae bacterium]|jgi:predicted permease
MSWFSRLRNHLRTNDVAREIDREMAFHLDERVDDLVARGMTPAAAEREARRRFGNRTYQKESARERDLFGPLDTLIGDVRYAIRALRAAPAFALVAILSLALGIGANTTIFTIIDALLLRRLPVQDPAALVAVVRDATDDEFTNPLWEAIRDRQDVFSGAFAFGETQFNLTSGGEARRVTAHWVSGGYFSTLGVRPAVGRLVSVNDDVRGCGGAAVLSHGFWETEYGGDRTAIGKTISLDGHSLPIIGVADASFMGLTVGAEPQVYVPLCAMGVIEGANSALDGRSSWFLQIVGRPKPGLTLAKLSARLASLGPSIIDATIPDDMGPASVARYRSAVFGVVPAATGFSDLRATYAKGLYILMGIVGLVLVIACANVANLLLARAAARQREIALRRALGASRGRIVRQLVTESLLLSIVGAGLGVALAMWGGRALLRLLSRSNAAIALDLSPDSHVLAFTGAVAVLTGLLFGLVPAWRAGRVDPQDAMKAQSRGIAGGRQTAGKLLVSAQIALSLMLVTGAALLLGSWHRLTTTNLGFRSDNLLLVRTDMRALALDDDQNQTLFELLIGRLRALPGVALVSGSQLTPISRSGWNGAIDVDGFVARDRRDAITWFNAITPGYFSTMSIAMRAGRDFQATDRKGNPPVAIVSEAMAQHFFHSRDVVGKVFRPQLGKRVGAPVTIVGVIANTKYRSIRDSAASIIFYPLRQQDGSSDRQSIELRSTAPLSAVAPWIRAAIAQVDPRIVLDLVPLERQIGDSMTLMRTVSSLAAAFGVLALVLASVGLYGVMSYGVARRRNEIGVRIALGAGRSRVVRMILSETAGIVALGVVAGIVLSAFATRFIVTFLYDIRPNDPASFSAAAAILAVVGGAAAALPAWRAATLDPVASLREE